MRKKPSVAKKKKYDDDDQVSHYSFVIMGSGASSSKFNRRIYVRTHTGNIVTVSLLIVASSLPIVAGFTIQIEFSSNCTTQDLKDLLTTAAGLSK